MKTFKYVCGATLAFASTYCLAQQVAINTNPTLINAPDTAASSTPSIVTAKASSGSANSVSIAVKPPADHSLTDRWLELDTLSHSERYRNAFAVGGDHVFENAQQRSLIAGKIKLDAAGRYDIGFRASSGRYFNWAYGSYTGTSVLDTISGAAFQTSYYTPAQDLAATQAVFADPAGFDLVTTQLKSKGWQFYMRELYFSATPLKPVTVEFGSFGIERGLSTEITTFDEDGYLSGERIRFHDPKHLFFDEAGFTSAYFGDISTPNLFARGSSLTHFNYRQTFVRKQLNKRAGFSGEYTWQAGTDTLREAAVIGVQESKVADSLRFEAYERLNTVTFPGVAESPFGPVAPLAIKGASGFAVAAQKKWGKFSADAGYALVDSHYAVYAGSRFIAAASFPLNGDAYGVGRRPFLHASYMVAPGVTAFGFYTHEIGSQHVLTLNQQGLNAGMTLDLKAMINTDKRVF